MTLRSTANDREGWEAAEQAEESRIRKELENERLELEEKQVVDNWEISQLRLLEVRHFCC